MGRSGRIKQKTEMPSMENKQFAKQKCSPPPSTSDYFGATLSPIYNVETIWGRSNRIQKKKNRDAENGEQTIHQKKNVPPQKYLTSDCFDAPLSPIYNVEKVWCDQAGSKRKRGAHGQLCPWGDGGRGESLNQESEVSTFAG